MIDKNTFNNNFATEFGTAIAIIKYERDYVNLDCKGVRLFNNQFKDNFGCPYVRGTAIISCIPDKPKLSPFNAVYQNQLDEVRDYMIGYFVSTNDINSVKSNPPPGPITRFTSLTQDEVDVLTSEVFDKFLHEITSTKGIVLDNL